MRSFLSASRIVSVATLSGLFLALTEVVYAQDITPADVEQQYRDAISAWNARDPVKIRNTAGASGGFGFGFRTRAFRDFRDASGQESETAMVRKFLSSLEYLRITLEEIHATVDGNVGFAWGFQTEEFQLQGRPPEKVRVRFTMTLKRDAGRWRQLLHHRDAQPFDDLGNYIPAPVAPK